MKILEIKKSLTDENITHIVLYVREKIIGNRNAKWGDCEDLSIGIAKVLNNLNFICKIVDGIYEGKIEKEFSPRGHVWVILDDKIIDGSFDQFNENKKVNILKYPNADYKPIQFYKNIERFFEEPMFNKLKYKG